VTGTVIWPVKKPVPHISKDSPEQVEKKTKGELDDPGSPGKWTLKQS